MIVDIKCTDETVQIGRIIHDHANMHAVNFLIEVSDNIYNFSNDTILVSPDSVTGFYDVTELEDTGLFVKYGNGYMMLDDSDDENYIYSGSESDDCSEISFVSEEEIIH